jgi:hypothetical protein
MCDESKDNSAPNEEVASYKTEKEMKKQKRFRLRKSKEVAFSVIFYNMHP